VAPTVSRTSLDDTLQAGVLALADLIEREDGAPPLSDQTLTRLRSGDVVHLIARDGDRLVGYAQLDGDELEIAGLTAAAGPLLDATRPALDAAGPLLVWSHGRRSRLIPVLDSHGFHRSRELHQLRRPLDAEHPLPEDPPLGPGVTVRAFAPGRDDTAWLTLNAAAFAHHPEQGRMTQADLDARIAESWFDPAGFLVAERGGELVAFHWTKIHPDGLGEVYVLGVSPSAQGLGLGGALLVRGLRHLRRRGCPAVLLYVDGDNPTALHLYERDGFARFDLDVQWQSA